jgi:lipooligosaccharide transport system ATP-binding protein
LKPAPARPDLQRRFRIDLSYCRGAQSAKKNAPAANLNETPSAPMKPLFSSREERLSIGNRPLSHTPRKVVEARGLSKYYGTECAVDHISFAIEAGEFCGILGPNGAGKTTALRMLAGNAPLSSGDLSVLGYRIPAQAREMRAKIGIVPQQDNLDPDFTVRENLMVYGRYFGLTKAETKQRIPGLLALAALPDKADHRISQLSGGMKRRLSIARALINRPELLILDEPTTGLDPQIRQNLWQLMRQLQQEGLTIILTTHYMDEAQRLCNRIILMDYGRILADQSPETLIRDSIEPHVLEVHGADMRDWQNCVPLDRETRCERVGETWFYYGGNLQRLVKSLDNWPTLRYSYRPANLEDVFLKMTGRELRDS